MEKSDLETDKSNRNFFLKSHGMRGIIVAVVVVSCVFLISIISKMNDVRLQKVPMVWGSRLKTMVLDCKNQIDEAKRVITKDPTSGRKLITEAKITLDNIRKIGGKLDISKLSGVNIDTLQADISNLLNNPSMFANYEEETTPQQEEENTILHSQPNTFRDGRQRQKSYNNWIYSKEEEELEKYFEETPSTYRPEVVEPLEDILNRIERDKKKRRKKSRK